MSKENKDRTGSSHDGGHNEGKGDHKQTSQPGAPNKSNRQTGGNQRHDRDDSNKGPDKNTTKKGANSV